MSFKYAEDSAEDSPSPTKDWPLRTGRVGQANRPRIRPAQLRIGRQIQTNCATRTGQIHQLAGTPPHAWRWSSLDGSIAVRDRHHTPAGSQSSRKRSCALFREDWIRVYPSHRRLSRERERMSYPHPGSESIRVTHGFHERE
jgi:hypothetical protein